VALLRLCSMAFFDSTNHTHNNPWNFLPMPVNALILSGGGARAAYQVGVLQALSTLLPHLQNPFPIICGTSAGAINALHLAAHMGEFRDATADLARIWRDLQIHQVYHAQWQHLLGGVGKIAASLFNRGVGFDRPLSLLDNSPLRDLLRELIVFENLDKRIKSGLLEAVSVTALGYTSGDSVTFFQGAKHLQSWRRARRVGTAAQLTVEHLLASSAIPTIFPAVFLEREYFGDGAMRQMAPISPALHLGADRIVVVGVSGNRNPENWARRPILAKHSPSMGNIVGQMFNSSFIDALEGDLEHLERVNSLLRLLGPVQLQKNAAHLRPVETLVISPSKPLDKIAGRHVRDLPPAMRFFMRATGATRSGGGASAASYLLFSNAYCNELIELGYQDAMWERPAIEKFFADQACAIKARA
jgi:NTE family protein